MTPQEALDCAAAHFSYDPSTGELIYRDRPREMYARAQAWAIAKKSTGKPAGTLKRSGYRVVWFGGRLQMAHRVIWLLQHGNWPVGEIDHINGNPSDNRITNLRDVPPSINRMNQRRRSDNTSGATGVHRKSGKWTASICMFGKRHNLGVFENREAAIAARNSAQLKMPFGPNHGAKP